MRRLLLFACRAFPRDHRARRSDEVVDTALLAANGSASRAAREAVSLLVAGLRERLRAESRHAVRDGLVPLAWLLATVNLAIALGGITLGVHPPPYPDIPGLGPFAGTFRSPYVLDWWWIAFAVAAAGVVLGLVLGSRRLAVGAALANVGIVAYDAVVVANGSPYDGRGHLNLFTYFQAPAFPGGREWFAAAAVLVLATAAAPLRRLPLVRVPLTFALALLLVVLSLETSGRFLFLVWPFAAIVMLGIAFGAFAPRIAVVAVGVALVGVQRIVWYLTTPYIYHDPLVKWVAAPGLALGILLPLAYLTRRRLT